MTRRGASPVDMATTVGSVSLPHPVMTASGTAGHATELGAYLELGALGAFVAKSLAAFPWAGNAAPRVHQTPAGMVNAVGLQGPGLTAWLDDELPELIARGVQRVVVSIWGRSVDDYAQAAALLRDVPPQVLAMEVNLSCPNTEAGRHLFAHDPVASAEVIDACSVAGLPRWAKLSPNTDRLVDVAGAVHDAGASAVTLINTVLGMVIDVEQRKLLLGNGGGGLSGAAIHPVAVRAIWDVHDAYPSLPIVGAGGVHDAESAISLMLAGASAVQIGTANFSDPRVVGVVQSQMEHWCRRHGVAAVTELIGGAHG